MDCEQNNVKAVKEIPQQPSRQRSITPIEPQVVMSKRPRSIERSITPIEPQIPMPKRQRSLDNPGECHASTFLRLAFWLSNMKYLISSICPF